MKKQKFNKKLSLNKETISNLNEIKGGGGKGETDEVPCKTDDCPTVQFPSICCTMNPDQSCAC